MAKNQGSQEDTQETTEVKGSPADTPETAEQAEQSRKAMKLGESRKAAFSTLVELAGENEAARAKLRELAKDEYNREYLLGKFGDNVESLLSKEEGEINPEAAALLKIQEQITSLTAEREKERQQQLLDVKSKLGLTQDQESEFDDMVKTLNGSRIGGKEVTFEEAIARAARVVRPGVSVPPSGRGDVSRRPEDKAEDDVKISLDEGRIHRHSFYTKAKSADEFKDIAKAFREKGSYTIK